MTWGELAQMLVALATLYTAWRTGRTVRVVAHEMNSIRDQLVVTTRNEAHAAELLQGRKEARQDEA